MANITVSSDIDSFLQAADKGAGRTALGASAEIVTPSVGYATTSGNDTTGDGSLAKPYKTAQKLADAGFTVWHLGVGAFGNLSISTEKTFYIHGEGSGKTTIGTVTNTNVTTLALVDFGRHSFSTGNILATAGGSIIVEGVVVSGSITLSQSEEGSNAGSATVSKHSVVASGISATGGLGIGGDENTQGGTGGSVGTITVSESYVGTGIESTGGEAGSDGGVGRENGGDGGNIVVERGSYVDGYIRSQGGVGTSNGNQGTITVTMSEVTGTLDPDSGSGNLGSLIAGSFITS